MKCYYDNCCFGNEFAMVENYHLHEPVVVITQEVFL